MPSLPSPLGSFRLIQEWETSPRPSLRRTLFLETIEPVILAEAHLSISFDERLGVSPDVLINVVDGQSVLLNLKTERYFSLDEVGTSMWHALTSSASLRAACDRLLAEYDAEPAKLETDLRELAEKLVENGLLEVRGG